jgi:hypothetical protein
MNRARTGKGRWQKRRIVEILLRPDLIVIGELG